MDKFESLATLKDSDLKQYSYQEVCKVLEALSSVTLSDFRNNEEIIEDAESYINYLEIIEQRANNGDFTQINDVEVKEMFLWKISNLKTNLVYMLNMNNSLNQVLQQNRKLYERVQAQRYDIDQELLVVQRHLEDSEHTTLTHVMSLLGVFTAIITIIITLVSESSSWLKNSKESDAFFAFVVPCVVILIAVSTLMLLVYFFTHHDKVAIDIQEKKAKRNSKIIAISVMLGIIILFSAILSLIFINTAHTKHAAHVRYIISSDQYEIVEEPEESSNNCPHNTECNCHTKIEIKKYFEITFEGKKYRFEYKEKLKHDGNLYFCAEHEILE